MKTQKEIEKEIWERIDKILDEWECCNNCGHELRCGCNEADNFGLMREELKSSIIGSEEKNAEMKRYCKNCEKEVIPVIKHNKWYCPKCKLFVSKEKYDEPREYIPKKKAYDKVPEGLKKRWEEFGNKAKSCWAKIPKDLPAEERFTLFIKSMRKSKEKEKYGKTNCV